jgi:endonuclease/exonuclease/phosphatase family metal-dependent hydrolase
VILDRVHVATLNIRNQFDRWEERLPLLLADMQAEQPDLMGLQEVAFTLQQDRLLASSGPSHYRTIRGWVGIPQFGNSLLVREPLEAGEGERADLGHLDRSAIGSLVRLPSGNSLLLITTHVLGDWEEPTLRDAQVARLIAWLDTWPSADATVIVGDFNVRPGQPPYVRMAGAGFRSAYLEATGAEPIRTFPSGIKAPGQDDGPSQCLDYIWVRGDVRVESCRLAFDRPAVGDATLYPSDHVGLSARLIVGQP